MTANFNFGVASPNNLNTEESSINHMFMNRLSSQLRDLVSGRKETEIRRITNDEIGVTNMMVRYILSLKILDASI